MLGVAPIFYWAVLTRQGSDGSWPDGSYLSWHSPSVNSGVPVSTEICLVGKLEEAPWISQGKEQEPVGQKATRVSGPKSFREGRKRPMP